MKKEVGKHFNIERLETIDILRGIFPFFYLNFSIKKNGFVRKLRKFLESRKENTLIKYFGSNLVLRGYKK